MDPLTGLPPLVEKIVTALDASRIRWALLRGRAGLGVSGRDMDLLVDSSDLVSLEDAVFALGGIALPRSLHPWHRFYVIEDAGETITLDVVTQLIYNRRLRIRSGLESGCLDRRRHDGAVWVLNPTDMFWTVLLHCVLDKQSVSDRRSAELQSLIAQVTRPGPDQPGPGEHFFQTLCPAGWSADRALGCVAAGDWPALVELGRQLSPPVPTERRRIPGVAAARRGVRAAARAGYPLLWRRAGLGVTPHLLDVADGAGIDVALVSLRRRPWVCDLLILVSDEQTHRLLLALRRHNYWQAAGRWNRVSSVGIERVRLVSPNRLSMPAPTWQELWRSSTPVPGRVSSRRASAGTTLRVTTMIPDRRGPAPTDRRAT